MDRSWAVHGRWLGRASIVLVFVWFLLPPSLRLEAQNAAPADTRQQGAEPAWLSYERGMHAYRLGRFGIALRHFRSALDSQPVFPEALASIGRVYRQDGNIALAERYLREALDQSAQLYVPEQKYAISYDLAALHRITRNHSQRLDVFRDILGDHYLSADQGQQTRAFMRVLRGDGIDRLLTLYRLEMDFSYEAYGRSGILYVEMGRYNDAVRNLSVAAIQALSTVINEIRRWDLDYEYTELDSVLARVADDEDLREFADSVSLYEVLYYLAAALYGDTSIQRALEIWSVLQGRPEAEEYQRRSRVQVESPAVEPVVDF